MDLNTVWFVIITILFTGYFFLEGFDFGVGILLPFLGKDDRERRMIINTIGPFWDGNEVWLITAGGAMFAAFPHWYATLFSGFYLPMVLMLFALIVRGVAFEFRSKDERPGWRSAWDWMIFIGSLIPALLWGVAMANLLRGIPIDENMTYVGGFWNLLDPFTLVCGLTSLTLFTLHGANFLSLKTEGEVEVRARTAAMRLWPIILVIGLVAVGIGFLRTDLFDDLKLFSGVGLIIAAAALCTTGWFMRRKQSGWAFIMTGVSIIFSAITLFVSLYPQVMVSSLRPETWSLTVYNASSSPYTLKVMTIIALIFIPIVLLYQGWSYYIFRERIRRESSLEY
jgi:cytochrome d ubiquinol oxidase subunit II